MDELTLSTQQSMTVRESVPDLFEVETTYGPGGKPPPVHFHPAQDEHFEIQEGEVEVRVDGRARTLRQGDTLDIPRGVKHQMWNPGDRPAHVLWQTRPAGRTEDWFRAIDALNRQGALTADGAPHPLAFAVIATEYHDVFRLAAAPWGVLRPLLAVLAVVGRVRGFKPHPQRGA